MDPSFPKLPLMKLVKRSDCQTVKDLQHTIHQLYARERLLPRSLLERLSLQAPETHLSTERAMGYLYHCFQCAPFDEARVNAIAEESGVNMRESLVGSPRDEELFRRVNSGEGAALRRKSSSNTSTPRSPPLSRSGSHHRRTSSKEKKKPGNPLAAAWAEGLSEVMNSDFMKRMSAPTSPGNSKKKSSSSGLPAIAQTVERSVQSMVRRVSQDLNFADEPGTTPAFEHITESQPSVGFLEDDKVSLGMTPFYPLIAKQAERGFGTLRVEVVRACVDIPAQGVAKVLTTVGLHRKVQPTATPEAPCSPGQPMINHWSNNRIEASLFSPEAVLQLDVAVTDQAGVTQTAICAVIPVRSLVVIGGGWLEGWLSEGSDELVLRRPVGRAIQLRAQVEFSKIGEFFSFFIKEVPPVQPPAKWTVKKSKQNLDHFLMYARPIAMTAKFGAGIVKWVNPVHTMLTILIYLFIAYWPLMGAILIHLGILAYIARNKLVMCSQSVVPSHEPPMEQSEAFMWADLGVQAIRRTVPMPKQLEADLQDLQNDVGEVANDLEEFFSLFNWTVDHDTEIVSIVTVASLLLHIMLPPLQVMLILGVAVFLRYTIVYRVLHTLGTGFVKFHKKSWSKLAKQRQ